MISREQQRAIAIGGSTGAIPAIRQVLQRLPAELPGPVFLVLHVGSESQDMLAQILDSQTDVTVKTAEDGEEALAGTVYVAPADHHLLVIDRVVRLGLGPRENLARPAVDPLFRSVGACYGGGAIAVLLSGKLNDGAAGLADLKRCGGTTRCKAPRMPSHPTCPWERWRKAISITALQPRRLANCSCSSWLKARGSHRPCQLRYGSKSTSRSAGLASPGTSNNSPTRSRCPAPVAVACSRRCAPGRCGFDARSGTASQPRSWPMSRRTRLTRPCAWRCALSKSGLNWWIDWPRSPTQREGRIAPATSAAKPTNCVVTPRYCGARPYVG